MRRYSRFFGLIGIVILIYLFLNIDLSLLLVSFKNINLSLFLISLLMIPVSVSVKSFKWLFLVERKDKIPFKKAMGGWIAGFGFGVITPARAGDFLRAKFLKTKLGKSLLTVLIDRLNDVFALFILGIVSVIVLFSRKVPPLNLSYLFALFFVVFLAGIFLIRKERLIKKLGRPLYRYFVPKKYKQEIGETFKHFYKNLEKIQRKKVLVNFLLTFLAWSLIFVQYWFLSLALGLGLNLIAIALVTPILLLVQLIPISISGLGTREAAAVIFLGIFGISPELAIALSLGILIEDYILGGIGLLIWLKEK